VRLGFEREMLGLYVSDHPLKGLEHVLAANRDITIGGLLAEDGPKDGMVSVAGMVTAVNRKQTKEGKTWAIVSIEDLEAALEVLMYPKVYEQVGLMLSTDTVVRIRGRVRSREESVELIASEVSVPNVALESGGGGGPVVISIPAARCTPAVVEQLKQVLSTHPGVSEVRLRLVSHANKSTLWRVDERLRVQPSQPLMADLKALLGPSCVSV
jgi:DNA polymerase-3 subunit alpha